LLLDNRTRDRLFLNQLMLDKYLSFSKLNHEINLDYGWRRNLGQYRNSLKDRIKIEVKKTE